MELSHTGRLATLMTTAVFVFAGCGGTTGAVPQAGAKGAAISKGAYSGALLYATYYSQSAVEVFTYPGGRLVQTLKLSSPAWGICSDNSGNVFMPAFDGDVYEYAHGANKPKATLGISGSDERANACAVDPATNNLAVDYYPEGSGGGFNGVAVFPNESGTPILYNNMSRGAWNWIGYDDSSDLFISGQTIFERMAMWDLPAGSTQILAVDIQNNSFQGPGQVQWDGKYITVQTAEDYQETARFTFSTQGVSRPGYISGTVVGVTPYDCNDASQSWIQASTLIISCTSKHDHYGSAGRQV